MNQRLAHVTLLVREYDEAIAFYTTVLGFSLAPTWIWAAASAGWW